MQVAIYNCYNFITLAIKIEKLLQMYLSLNNTNYLNFVMQSQLKSKNLRKRSSITDLPLKSKQYKVKP